MKDCYALRVFKVRACAQKDACGGFFQWAGMARLCKDLDARIKNRPQLTWGNTLPRILSVHEEMKTFLSALFIEGAR